MKFQFLKLEDVTLLVNRFSTSHTSASFNVIDCGYPIGIITAESSSYERLQKIKRNLKMFSLDASIESATFQFSTEIKVNTHEYGNAKVYMISPEADFPAWRTPKWKSRVPSSTVLSELLENARKEFYADLVSDVQTINRSFDVRDLEHLYVPEDE